MHLRSRRGALSALTALLAVLALGACDDYQDAPEPAETPTSEAVGPPPDPVSLGGLKVEPPEGYAWYDVREGQFAQLIPVTEGAIDERETLNMLLVRTVVGDDGSFVPADDDVLGFLRAATGRYDVTDLGTIQVSEQEVPVVRIASRVGGVAFCATATSEEVDSCFGAGVPGSAYAFVATTGGRTVVVERADLAHLQEWADRLTLDPTT